MPIVHFSNLRQARQKTPEPPVEASASLSTNCRALSDRLGNRKKREKKPFLHAWKQVIRRAGNETGPGNTAACFLGAQN